MNDTHDEEACLLSHCPGILFAPWESWSLTRDVHLSLSLFHLKALRMNCWVSSQHLTSFSLEWWNSNYVLLSLLSNHFLLPKTRVRTVNTHNCLRKCSDKPAIRECSGAMSPYAHMNTFLPLPASSSLWGRTNGHFQLSVSHPLALELVCMCYSFKNYYF